MVGIFPKRSLQLALINLLFLHQISLLVFLTL
jgi:hypothetical protein